MGLSSEIMKVKRKWHHIFKVLKKKYCQFRIQFSLKLSFRKETHRGKLRRFIVRRLALKRKVAKRNSLNRRETILEGKLK